MVVERGDAWWANLDEACGSELAFRRPVLVVQADTFNRSRLQTTLGIALTSNTRLITAPGNVLLPSGTTGLPTDSVANVTQLVTLYESYLSERVGRIPRRLMVSVDAGLKLVLDL